MNRSYQMVPIIPIFIFIYFSFCTKIMCQDGDYYKKLEVLLEDTPEGKKARFEHVLRSEFSQLVRSNSNGLLGNYIGLSTKDKTLDLSLNKTLNRGIIELNIAGSINDDITGIFAQNKFKTDTELGLKYHKIFQVEKLSASLTEFESIRKELKELKNNKDLIDLNFLKNIELARIDVEKKRNELIELQKKYYKIISKVNDTSMDERKDHEYVIQKELIEAEIKLLESKVIGFNLYSISQISELKRKRDSPSNSDQNKYHQFNLDSLKVLNELILMQNLKSTKEKELKELENKITENLVNDDNLKKLENEIKLAELNLKISIEKYDQTKDNSIIDNNNDYEEKRRKTLDKLIKIKGEDVHFCWLSFSGSISNQNYTIFDKTRPFENQMFKETDLIPSLGVSFSIFRDVEEPSFLFPLKKRNITLFVVGAQLKYGNNINNLKQIEIQTIDSITENRAIVDSRKAFEGNFERGLETGQVYLDYYGSAPY